MIRLITWNVARRTSRLPDQAAVLAERRPDVVALQEVTRRTLPLWRRAFELMGLTHVRVSEVGPATVSEESAGRTLVMVASRPALEGADQDLQVPRGESAVSVVVNAPSERFEVHCVHVPNAANGWVKVETLRALRLALGMPPRLPRVLCGDLNIPRRELPDGTTISFARDTRGRLRADRGAGWDAAELGIVPGLRELGYRDVYRTLHGYARAEPSWTWRTIAGHDGGWRLDHIFASDGLLPRACEYHHEWRERGLSDHSALEADLEFSLA